MAKKLCGGFLDGGPRDEPPYHNMAYTEDNKLWVLDLTGVELPKRSWFHRTTLHGGNVLCFDLASNQWGKPVAYDPIDKDENLEEFVFGKGSDLYMCVYSRYETSEVKKLLKWDSGKGVWAEIKLEIDATLKSSCREADWVFAVDPNRPVVYIAMAGGGMMSAGCLAKLELGSDGATVKKVMDIPRIGKLQMPGSRPLIMGVTDGGKVLVISGCEMCGFWWQPESMLELDPETKSAKDSQIQANGPPFSYAGPRSTGALGQGNQWLMVGGSTAVGMHNAEFSHELWAVDLKNPQNPAWKRMGADIPSEVKGEYHFSAVDGKSRLFIGDPETGVFQIDF